MNRAEALKKKTESAIGAAAARATEEGCLRSQLPPVVVAEAPEDLIACVPHFLGFWPESSIVLLVLENPGDIPSASSSSRAQPPRVAACLRLDIPPSVGARPVKPKLSAPEGSPVNAVISQIIRQLRSLRSASPETGDGAGVAALLFTGIDWADERDPGYDDFMAGLAIALASEGHSLTGSWWVGARWWRDYLCRDERCCPLGGYPLAMVRTSRVNLALMSQGSDYRSDGAVSQQQPNVLDELLNGWPGLSLSYRRTAKVAFLKASPCFTESLNALEQRRQEALDLWEGILNGNRKFQDNPQLLGYLAASLGDRAIRDAVLIATAGGRGALTGYFGADADEVGPEAHSRGSASAKKNLPMSFGELLFGISSDRAGLNVSEAQRCFNGQAPEHARVLRCIEALQFMCRFLAQRGEYGLVAAALRESLAAALTILAWLEWCRGRGGHCRGYLLAALGQVPDYRLAVLFKQLFDNGLVSQWATVMPAEEKHSGTVSQQVDTNC
ncbi:DUF4192 domain-containing protein [Acaricomes phytoseiuli]|uniref:DUF4192 domain-containing protein n=1 Tax=Acaricomes phytoseiuli TaxID=291968 RepID=UPI0022224859|nr:DUF4192 domain-containing protein [Acaricomes phytoseiuli]MCW1249106.1 DUF4192 domain-containing protein [Acaricomes phytoseiuli]